MDNVLLHETRLGKLANDMKYDITSRSVNGKDYG